MRAVRVRVRADVVSFRHPFFVTGRQLGFDCPPPSTIHGHCASALGSWPDRDSFRFAYHFDWRSRSRDLEHEHLAKAKASKDTDAAGDEVRTTTEISVQPVWRDFLFGCTLDLYLPHNPKIVSAFRSPVYTVVLGRSQDLAEVESVEDVDLVKSEKLVLQNTILPRAMRPAVRFGTTVLLSRYISEPPERNATFAQYIWLKEPVYRGADPGEPRAFIESPEVVLDDLWADPTIVDDAGFPRGVYLHRLVD